MATPPIKRSTAAVSELARIPHSALCPAAAPSRFPELREPIPTASARECTCEPLLGPVDLEPFALPDWVIVGGESGPSARPMHPDWVRDLRDQCTEPGLGPQGVAAFFFKQWGAWGPTNQVGAGVGEPDEVCLPDSSVRQLRPDLAEGRWFKRFGKKSAGRELDGRTWDEFPAAAS